MVLNEILMTAVQYKQFRSEEDIQGGLLICKRNTCRFLNEMDKKFKKTILSDFSESIINYTGYTSIYKISIRIKSWELQV